MMIDDTLPPVLKYLETNETSSFKIISSFPVGSWLLIFVSANSYIYREIFKKLSVRKNLCTDLLPGNPENNYTKIFSTKCKGIELFE